ncbi:TonB-dependent receptor [Roseateles noduli]|nr:TonB-dependent receptor [Roseateles noduli]
MKHVHPTRQRQVRGLQRQPVAAACALLFFAAAAHAQQAPAAPEAAASEAQRKADATIDTVVVSGIRQSLDTSLNLKRQQRGVVDGIVAEDIGKFPDTNLAESMQRIAGVSIDRSMGEGSKVTVRGVGPDFNMVLLNGRQMPASSIQDTGPSNSRAFDFANLASESISALEVYKTSRASTPTGGIGATINIKTARPLDTKRTIASVGVKAVHDQANSRLPDNIKGDSTTPEVSGIFSTTFADGMFGLAVTGSYQKRDGGYNSAGVPGGWLPFKGNEVRTPNLPALPQPGEAGAGDITNRPGPNDIYSLPQNVNYNMNGFSRERTNGQVTFQFAPTKSLTTTLDYTASQNKVHTRRNDLSAWFSFGPSTSSWTNGPVSAPLNYTELITAGNADLAMGGADFATKNDNKSLGFNADWKATDKLRFEFDAHKSTATSGADGPWGTNNVIGTASFNRGQTGVDFTQEMPVLIMPTTQRDASKQLVTGSAFRNSYMKSEVDQQQVRGTWKITDESKLDFGAGLTKVKNRSAYSNVQLDTWGGATNPGDYPDTVWLPQDLRQFFGKLGGIGDPRQFTQFYTFDFGTVRDLAAKAWSDPKMYEASNVFSTDRRTTEKSSSAFAEYTQDWELGVPMSATVGMRYEKTKVNSTALVPTATGITWGSNNELTVLKGAPGFTELDGKYSYWLPSIDWDADLTDKLKLRASFGTSIGRPGWDAIQGGQTLNDLARVNGGTGSQGNPGLKPLKAKNFDLSLEYYYAKSSYIAGGLFRKNISNYIGSTIDNSSPFNLTTPIGGKLYNEASSTGGCGGDLTCIRNYILNTYNGQQGVVRTGFDTNGNAQGTIAGQPGDPIANFQITVPANTQSNSLKGFELNVQHAFGNSGFGVAANYTKVKSGLKYDNMSIAQQYALIGLSDSANLVGFYEDARFSVRVAYNWRDKFLAAVSDGNTLGRSAPIFTEAYSQVDVSLGYNFSEKLSLQAEVINLGDSILRQHGRTSEEVFSVTQTGRRYMLGLRYKF